MNKKYTLDLEYIQHLSLEDRLALINKINRNLGSDNLTKCLIQLLSCPTPLTEANREVFMNVYKSSRTTRYALEYCKQNNLTYDYYITYVLNPTLTRHQFDLETHLIKEVTI